MKLHTKTFKTVKEAQNYKKKIINNYSEVRIIPTGMLYKNYGNQPKSGKAQVRAVNY